MLDLLKRGSCLCVQPGAVDTCLTCIKKWGFMGQIKVFDAAKSKGGTRLPCLAFSVKAAQLFALPEPQLFAFVVGWWRARCILSHTERSDGSPWLTVICKREHFFETVKCPDF